MVSVLPLANELIVPIAQYLSVPLEHEIWVLWIENVTTADSGMYSCEVNSSPKQRVVRFLSVIDEPAEGSTIEMPSGASFGGGNSSRNFPVSLMNVDHNYTECCIHESVPSSCHTLCNFQGLVSGDTPPKVVQGCLDHLSSITKCLTDGRNHEPCCVRQNIPEQCRPVCQGNFTLTRVTDHFTCMDYAAPILACIAEGIETLPPQPKRVGAYAQSSTTIKIFWDPPPTKVTISL